jgi:folylpolyglutamate synthase/dihydropteroate synthase
METAELKDFVPENFGGEIFEIETVGGAIKKAREISAGKDLILVTGSLYLVGEAQKILQSEFGI